MMKQFSDYPLGAKDVVLLLEKLHRRGYEHLRFFWLRISHRVVLQSTPSSSRCHKRNWLRTDREGYLA